MSHSAPFRQRPNLHLALTQSTGSPRNGYPGTPIRTPITNTPISTPGYTPLGTTAYSPIISAGAKTPTPFGSNLSLPPRRSLRQKGSVNKWHRFKRAVFSRPILLLGMILALTFWWFNGGGKEFDEVKLGATELGREFLKERRMQAYQFYPATNPRIHYMGRWTSTPNRLRKDGTFPGVYFDVTVKNTSSFLIALQNAPLDSAAFSSNGPAQPPDLLANSHPQHVSFRPSAISQGPARPVSLLARVDDNEYVLLPNSSALVPVCLNSLSPSQEHHIRIVAPLTDDKDDIIIQIEGIWLSKGGYLAKVEGSSLGNEYENENVPRAESALIGEKHRATLGNFLHRNRFLHTHQHHKMEHDIPEADGTRRKVIEIVTDSPGSLSQKRHQQHVRTTEALLAGVLGWEYLLGEMFSADHVCIGVDGMCLIQDCYGGRGYPAGLGDVFFRSGPFGSGYFDHSWTFTAYVPDVLIFNVGESDSLSFDAHQEQYNKTMWDLTETFENTYVSLVKGIRRLGYTKHPALIESERLGSPGVIPHGIPISIPIFIMRPLRGQLEHATQNIVNKLRSEGDRSVFWLDTSGWLDTESVDEEDSDFYLDKSVTPPRIRLTEYGNQRVAIFLHTHVCRYLASSGDKCAFLPQEVYQGSNFDPDEANFDFYLETEKEVRLRKLFWDAEDVDSKEIAKEDDIVNV